jgi:hypothetical protein
MLDLQLLPMALKYFNLNTNTRNELYLRMKNEFWNELNGENNSFAK